MKKIIVFFLIILFFPYYNYAQGSWIEAEDLKQGDLILLADGKLCPVARLKIIKSKEPVFNFSVERVHNYYVSEDAVLVHNNDCDLDKLKKEAEELYDGHPDKEMILDDLDQISKMADSDPNKKAYLDTILGDIQKMRDEKRTGKSFAQRADEKELNARRKKGERSASGEIEAKKKEPANPKKLPSVIIDPNAN